MPYHKCTFDDDCESLAILGLGLGEVCLTCEKHLCDKHRQLPFHLCLNLSHTERILALEAISKRHYKRLRRKLIAEDLGSLASALRPGFPCEIEIPKVPRGIGAGGMHYHFPAVFDDGVEWLLRVPMLEHRIPRGEKARMKAVSECATLQVLHSTFGPKVPNAWMPSDNRKIRKIAGFFVEKVPGPFLTLWNHESKMEDDPKRMEILQRTIESYADFMITLSTIHFDSIGSIYPGAQPGTYEIGPLVTDYDHLPDPPYFAGPFRSCGERYTAHIDLILEEIEAGLRYPDERVEAYLLHLEYRSIVERCEALWKPNERFYVKHADDKGDRILVDEEGSVKAIIDWEWAYTTSHRRVFVS